MNRPELADAMLRGLYTEGVEDCQAAYIHVRSSGICDACALGCAVIGHYDGDYLRAREAFTDAYRAHRDEDEDETVTCAALLNIPIPLAVEIEHKHLNGRTVEQIAVWLKTSEEEGAQ